MSVISFEIGLLSEAEAETTIRNELIKLSKTREARDQVNPQIWKDLASKVEITIPTDKDGFTHQTLNLWCQDTWLLNAIRGKNFDGSERVETTTEMPSFSEEVQSMTSVERMKWENEILSRPVRNVILAELTEFVNRDESGKIVERYHYESDDLSNYVIVSTLGADGWEENGYDVRTNEDGVEQWFDYDDFYTPFREVYPGQERETETRTELIEVENPEEYDGEARMMNIGGGWAELNEMYTPVTTTRSLPPLFSPVFKFTSDKQVEEYNRRLKVKYEASIENYEVKKKLYEQEQEVMLNKKIKNFVPRFKEPRYPDEPVLLPLSTRELPLIEVPTRYITDLIGEAASKQSTQIIHCTRIPKGLNVKMLITYLHSVYDKYSWNNRTTNGHRHVIADAKETFPIISYGQTPKGDVINIAYRAGYSDGRDALISHRFLNYSADGKKHLLVFGHPNFDIAGNNFTTDPNPKALTTGPLEASYNGNRGGSSARGGSSYGRGGSSRGRGR